MRHALQLILILRLPGVVIDRRYFVPAGATVRRYQSMRRSLLNPWEERYA